MLETSDEQKVDMIKNIIKKYGNLAIGTVLILIILFVAFKLFNNSKDKKNIAQITDYKSIQIQIDAKQENSQENTKGYILANKNIYGYLTAFKLAKQSYDNNEIQEAIYYLDFINQNADKSSAISYLAKIRLAKAYIANGQFELGKKTLDFKFPDAFLAISYELLGDIYYLENSLNRADVYYNKALKLQNENVYSTNLTAKIDSLITANDK